MDRSPLLLAVQKRFFPLVLLTLWPLVFAGFLLMEFMEFFSLQRIQKSLIAGAEDCAR